MGAAFSSSVTLIKGSQTMHKFLHFPFAEYVLSLGNHESLPFLADSYEKKEFKCS